MRCIDHKLNVEVAVKINRNSSYDHSSSRTEIAILKKLKEGLGDENDEANDYINRVVEYRESFFFRNHYVRHYIINLYYSIVYCI